MTVNEFSFLILNYFVLLTIFTEVIHNNNSTQQVRRCPVNNTMNSAQEDRQPLFMKADYDSSGWKLGWVTVKFGFTTVRQIEFYLNFFIMLNLKFN